MASPPLYDILSTPYGGRGAFAREAIQQGTMVPRLRRGHMHTSCTGIPARGLRVVLRLLLREREEQVGREAGGRRARGGNRRVWFCTDACRAEYIREHEVFEGYGAEWRTEINIMSRRCWRGTASAPLLGRAVPPAGLVYLETNVPSDITPEYLDRAWAAARDVSDQRRGLDGRDDAVRGGHRALRTRRPVAQGHRGDEPGCKDAGPPRG